MRKFDARDNNTIFINENIFRRIKRGMPVSEVRNDLILFIKSLSNNSKINY